MFIWWWEWWPWWWSMIEAFLFDGRFSDTQSLATGRQHMVWTDWCVYTKQTWTNTAISMWWLYSLDACGLAWWLCLCFCVCSYHTYYMLHVGTQCVNTNACAHIQWKTQQHSVYTSAYINIIIIIIVIITITIIIITIRVISHQSWSINHQSSVINSQ